MANRVILSPEYFYDPTIGRPISNGSIYVGIIDLDPKVLANRKQISVLQEDGTTVEVSQPLSTGGGGGPVYNGSPVTILVDGSYSLRVDDKHGDQKFYVPKNAETDSLVSFDNIGDMRLITGSPVDGDVLSLLGYADPGDARGGQFYWDSTSTEADDDLDIIKATAITTGRFKRLITNTLPRGEITATAGKRYQVISGVIYFNTVSGDWRFLDNVDHAPVGFTGISTLVNGTIQLDHDFGGVKAISLLVSADETFSNLGVVAGASVGIALSLITISAPIEFSVDPATGTVTAPSYWGTEITASVSPSIGVCNVTHPAVQTGMAPVLTQAGSDFGNSIVRTDYSDTTVEMQGTSEIYGRFAYSGAAWVYSGSLFNTPTTAWNAGVLTVTHDASDLYSISVSSEGISYRASGAVANTTSFDIRFFDSDGNLITTEDTSMNFYFNRTGNARSNDLNGDFSVRRGNAQVDANNTFPTAGNFWLIGLIEFEY